MKGHIFFQGEILYLPVIFFLHLKTHKSPLQKDVLCKVWLNWHDGSGREDENIQVNRRTDGRQVIRKAHLSFQLRLDKRRKEKNELWLDKKVHFCLLIRVVFVLFKRLIRTPELECLRIFFCFLFLVISKKWINPTKYALCYIHSNVNYSLNILSIMNLVLSCFNVISQLYE